MCIQTACLCVIYLLTSGYSLTEFNWKSSVNLEPDGDVRLSWTPHLDRIVFQVEARTLGYVGVGFSPEGSTMGADVVIGWVDDNNQQAFLLDYHSNSQNEAPDLDHIQNYELLGGTQNKTHTVLRFQRPWDTCDHEHDRKLGDDTERLIWAMNKEDPQQNGQGFLSWHKKMWRGSRSVHLISVANQTPNNTHSDMMHWDVVLTNFSVPENMDTLYWCKIFRVPQLTHKHHIIGYEPLVSAGSENVVHHMLLYECAVPAGLMEQYLSHPGAACDSPNMPRLWEHCVTPSFAWSTSSTGEFLPDHVGIPIAEGKRSTFFMLEVHYDNPTLKQVIDSSGLRLFYTDKLRQHEGGMLVTGVVISPLQVIPPGQKAYKTAGYCDFHCTHSTLPPSGINVISALLHAHHAGSEITLRHIRAGLELSPIAKDKSYDYKYQQSRVLVEERQVLPGDEIITECIYNTAARTTPTIGGYSTKQEMCLGFVRYYPRAPLASCLSMTPVDFFFQIFGVKKFYHYNMTMIEKMFLQLTDIPSMKKPTSTTPPSFPKLSADDKMNAFINEEAISTLKKMADFSIESGEENNLFDTLIIEDPEEFQNKSFTSHLYKLPWNEQLFTKPIENTVYHGKHMTFCRLFNDSLQTAPQVFKFPNFTEHETPSLGAVCPSRKENTNTIASNKSNCNYRLINNYVTSVLVASVTFIVFR